MAKELPYFKFEPNQWENGNIQIVSREDKGLFVDVCSMYWSRLGVLPFKLAVQKLCNGNATAFDSLIKEGIFVVEDDMICIEFLNEQLQEFEDTSQTNRENALKRWRKIKESKIKSDRNATASKSQSESDAIRGEKRIEEDRKKNKRFTPPTVEEVKEYFTEKGYTTQSAERAFNYYDVADWKDSKGNKVKNWKQKMLSVWMKDENKYQSDIQPEDIELWVKNHLTFEQSVGEDPVRCDKYPQYNGLFYNNRTSKFQKESPYDRIQK